MSHTHTTNRVLAGLLGLSMIGTCAASARAADDQQTADKPAETKIRVTIYPILIKAPIFGASVDLPSLPSGGGGESGDVSGTTDTALNAAYMAGVLVEADRWFAEASGAYAALTASRATPRVNIDSKAYFYGGRGGVRILGGFAATGGFRHVSLDLDATLTLPALNKTIEGTATRGIWDPLVGVDWRRTAGSWTIDGNFQGGGFGVGADVDLSAELRARWRPAKHFEIRAGYSFLYLELTVANVSIGSFQRTLIAKQSLHGPEIGFGIVF